MRCAVGGLNCFFGGLLLLFIWTSAALQTGLVFEQLGKPGLIWADTAGPEPLPALSLGCLPTGGEGALRGSF